MTTTQGLKRNYRQRRKTVNALPGLAHLAETEMWGGPKDLAASHDKYFVDAWNKQKSVVAIEPSALSLEEVVGSVRPLQPHKSFKEMRDEAIEEHVERVVAKINR